jgi:hypothetical protein
MGVLASWATRSLGVRDARSGSPLRCLDSEQFRSAPKDGAAAFAIG